MSNQIELTTKYIKDLKPLAVASDKAIGEHFVNKFMAMYRVPKEQALSFYEREKDNFMKRISETDALKECTPMSIFLAFMQVGGWKLSFEGGSQSDVYLIPGNKKITVDGREVWIKEVVAQPSPYGEKKIRIETGQIKHVGTPTVVYDCDKYEELTGDNGRTNVIWKKGVRTLDYKITNGFILLEYPDGSREFKTFDLEDVASWEKASEKKNKGHANTLYGYEVTYEKQGNKDVKVSKKVGQIDRKFFEGKILKHAFKLFPRVIAAPKIPDNFVPIQEEAVRHGFDTSEFVEENIDTTYEEVQESAIQPNDDFDSALNEAKVKEPTEQIQYTEASFDDEPNFD